MEKYSYSKINLFYDCRLAFYKRYYEMVDGESHGTAEFGSFVHSILEQYAKGELTIDEMLPYYMDNYESNVVSDFELKVNESYSMNLSEKYFSDGYKYISNFKGFPDLEIIDVEYEFNEPIDDKFIFTGKVDLIGRDKNTGDLVIIDHKSKSKFKNKQEQAQYARQLYLYALAVERRFGELPKILKFNMFRLDTFVTIPFNQNDYESAVAWLKDAVTEIEECFEFPSTPNTFYCNNFCQCRNMDLTECEK